jgi:glycerol-3-phosphate dehydrogenase
LNPKWSKAFVYSDGWVDDARLVVLCAMDAAERGAMILPRTRCDKLEAVSGGWAAELAHQDPFTQAVTHTIKVRARAVVNAAGPWAEQMLRQVMGVTPRTSASGKPNDGPGPHLRLVKGSHIVVPRCFNHDHAYIFQGQDRRIIFAIPYERQFTLIGTTDVDHQKAPGAVEVDPEEVMYLCQQASRYFRQPVLPGDVVWTFSGVRPLLDDASGKAAAVTRDYRLEAHAHPSPWLTVWGGKLTTFRLLSEEAADMVGRQLGELRHRWTGDAILPGGQLTDLIDEAVHPEQDLAEFQSRLRRRHPWLDMGLMRRWSKAYGSRVLRMLDGVSSRADLGVEVAPDLYELELFYLKRQEWAMTAEDILWRRSKLGLHYTPEQRQAVADWLHGQAASGRTLGFHHSAMSRA